MDNDRSSMHWVTMHSQWESIDPALHARATGKVFVISQRPTLTSG